MKNIKINSQKLKVFDYIETNKYSIRKVTHSLASIRLFISELKECVF